MKQLEIACEAHQREVGELTIDLAGVSFVDETAARRLPDISGAGESRVMVRNAIERLPESYRTVLMLRDIEDLTTQEVADRLDMTANAVKVRLHRARQALRTLLSREIDG